MPRPRLSDAQHRQRGKTHRRSHRPNRQYRIDFTCNQGRACDPMGAAKSWFRVCRSTGGGLAQNTYCKSLHHHWWPWHRQNHHPPRSRRHPPRQAHPDSASVAYWPSRATLGRSLRCTRKHDPSTTQIRRRLAHLYLQRGQPTTLRLTHPR